MLTIKNDVTFKPGANVLPDGMTIEACETTQDRLTAFVIGDNYQGRGWNDAPFKANTVVGWDFRVIEFWKRIISISITRQMCLQKWIKYPLKLNEVDPQNGDRLRLRDPN